jgi:hypothetical protein
MCFIIYVSIGLRPKLRQSAICALSSPSNPGYHNRLLRVQHNIDHPVVTDSDAISIFGRCPHGNTSSRLRMRS